MNSKDTTTNGSEATDKHSRWQIRLGKLVKNHPYAYWTLLGVLALGPAPVFITRYGPANGLIISGLNALVVAYTGDFLQLFTHLGEPKNPQRVNAFHVFVVAWLLPFLLTLSPSIQNILEPNSLDGLVRELNPDLIAHCEPDATRFSDYQSLVERATIPVFLHSAIFSSLVVLLPLEFFALLFLEDPRSRAHRHGLIVAGCLDVATLSFLSLVATNLKLARIEHLHGRYVLVTYLIALWLLSLLSSFQAIYVAQYQAPQEDSEQPAAA